MRTDITCPMDAALSGRNAGSKAFWEVARSGNGDMRTDLLADDGRDYEEYDGLGETVEEMSLDESTGKTPSKPYREALPGETPPFAPKKGQAWVRRRIPTNSRRPGGNRLVRVRWAQVSPSYWGALIRQGKVMNRTTSLSGLGLDLSTPAVKYALYGGLGLLGVGVLLKLTRGSRRLPA